METEAILKEFNEHLEQYATHRGYIDRARTHAHKFKPEVVEKVILDHEIKSTEVAELILPLVPQFQEAMAELDAQRREIDQKKAGSEETMEELTLRMEIGEFTDDEFEQATSELKAELDTAAERLGSIATEYDTLAEALNRWVELAASADQDTGMVEAEPEPEPEVLQTVPEPEIEAEIALEPEIELDEGPAEPMFDDEPVVDEQEGIHVSVSSSVEDVSVAFGSDDGDVVELEAADGAGDEPSAEIDLGFGDEGGEVELALVGDGPVEVEGAEIEIATGDDGVDNRRALLLYQEGTPEEQIYPFTGDVITIGRGRDNDIQIKNDSKVSRYHCKVYRRGSNFYIEDNKSSNGTLVNGELITERRLFGGEEVIIGETFFRFRIME
jgi:hypothetical protein